MPLARLAPATLALLALTASAARAQTTYFGLDDPRGTLTNSLNARGNFLATLVASGTDNLESFANGTPAPTLVFGATGVTATTNLAFIATFPPLAESGANAVLDAGPATASDPGIPDVFNLSAPVTAFGSFFANAGDGGANTITFVLENTVLATSKSVVVGPLGPGATFDNVFFFGVTDTTPFNRVTMIESLDFDGILLDDVTIGFVPEPSSIVLLAGVSALALLRLRRGGKKT